jgi:hypothetical protein
VSYLGWSGLRNGDLLRAAEESGFEVFITGDKKLTYQQKLKGRLVAILTLSAQEWPTIKDHLPAILSSLDAVEPGSFSIVECGTFRR